MRDDDGIHMMKMKVWTMIGHNDEVESRIMQDDDGIHMMKMKVGSCGTIGHYDDGVGLISCGDDDWT
jgi:hypothetical protein